MSYPALDNLCKVGSLKERFLLEMIAAVDLLQHKGAPQ